jgi:hypothetical protein
MSGGLWFRAVRAFPEWGVSPGALLVYSAGVGGMGLRLQATERILTPNFLRVCDRVIQAEGLERAGVPRSVAMQLTGHKTEAVYRRYAIVSERDLSEGVAKLAHVHESPAPRTVLPFTAAASG